MLGHLAFCDTEPVRLLGGDTLARGQYARELAFVRADHRAPYRHRLPFRDGVLDVEAVIGKDGEEPVQAVLGPGAPVLGDGPVVEVLGCLERPPAPGSTRREPLQVVVLVEIPCLAVDPAVAEGDLDGLIVGDALDARALLGETGG